MRLNSICNECSKWKTMLQDAWNKATTAVQKIRDKDGNDYVPDGNGLVTIDYSPKTVNDIQTSVTENASNIASETTDRVSADNALQSQITANKTSIDTLVNDVSTNKSDISALKTTMAKGVLTGIARTSSGPRVTRQTVNASTGGVTTANLTIFKVGKNLSYETEEGTLSAVDTKYTAGTGVNISADNVISVSGSGQAVTASEVTLTDDRTVQTAIDAIEDEIGDESTAGSIKYVEKTNTDNIATNTSNITALQTAVAGKQDTLTAGEGIDIDSSNTIASTKCVINITSGYGVNKQLSMAYSRRLPIDSKVLTVNSMQRIFKLGTGLVFTTPDSSTSNPEINVDTSVIQSKLTAGDNITIADDGTISSTASGGTEYTAGDGITITDGVIANSGVRSLSLNAGAGTTSWTAVSAANSNRMVTLSHNGVTNGLFRGFYNNYTPVPSNSVASTYTSNALFLGGLIIQWGWFTAYGSGTSYHKATVNFRTAYTNANHYTVLTNIWDYGSKDLWSYQSMVETKTASSFTAHVSNGNSGTNITQDCRVMWLAIGY